MEALSRRSAWAGLAALALLLLLAPRADAQVNIDGGRSQLPGMKQDMFDRAQTNKKQGPQGRSKGPPDCPKSDKMSPFFQLAFVSGEMYVKWNDSDAGCVKLLTVGGANYSVLANASRTCGPAGEWKRRIAEEMSAVFFQAGLDWVKNENDTIEIVTEDGAFEVPVTEARFAEQSECWARGCSCEQAKNPVGRAILLTCLAVGVGGLMFDSVRLSWEKIKGKKPSRHVLDKKGFRMEETKFNRSYFCDVCGARGTSYQSSNPDNRKAYDMCKTCYKDAKKKLKAELEAWYVKHPEEKAKDEEKKREKKKKGEKGDSDDDNKDGSKAESEAESTTKAESESKAESNKADTENEDEGAKASGEGESGKDGESGKEGDSGKEGESGKDGGDKDD
mmetsp:Transcript_131540/g.328087  ORF Transcript_131540/g.328087 Transcript_131540/m.328087 type:complete len:391 (-) Transcript_131540:139-1311(-)